MTIGDLKHIYLNEDDGEHVPKVGRYSASQLYSYFMGYKKPEDFFKEDPIKEAHHDIVIRGMMAEDMLAKMLLKGKVKVNCGDNQSKYEIKISEEITIVTKPDFEFLDKKGDIIEVWETKYPAKMITSVPNKWKYQLQCEYEATKKPVKLGVFSEPFNLTLIDYEPSQETWEEIKRRITKFHEKLCQSQLTESLHTLKTRSK